MKKSDFSDHYSYFKRRKSPIDLEKIKAIIETPVKERLDKGVYEHFDLSKVLHYEIQDAKNPSEYLNMVLKSLEYSWAIDINDFLIPHSKNSSFFKLAILTKKVIWKLLKFYTFRLFYQQRELNSQVANAVKYLKLHQQKEIQRIEKEIHDFEVSKGAKS